MPGFEYARQRGAPYGMACIFLLSPKHLPCDAPPWGTLTAIDVNAGERRWEVPLGSTPWIAGQQDLGPGEYGSPSLGGPIATASGLTFIGGTLDGYMRAFDSDTGKQLWKAKLPSGARATPMTYEADRKQYLLIAAGGFDTPGSAVSDTLVAFALP